MCGQEIDYVICNEPDLSNKGIGSRGGDNSYYARGMLMEVAVPMADFVDTRESMGTISHRLELEAMGNSSRRPDSHRAGQWLVQEMAEADD